MQPETTVSAAPVSRRAALGLGAAALATLSAGAAFAEGDMDHAGSHDGQGSHDGHGGSAMGGKHKALIDSGSACLAKGEACVAHCIDAIKAGDTSMIDCLKSVQIMLPMCAALTRLAAFDAARLKEFVAVCKDVCADCEAECKKHADKHAVCKDCMDSCAACIKECKAVLDA